MSAMLNFKVIRVDDLQWDVPFHRKPNLYIEIRLGGIIEKTHTIKDKYHAWDETLSFPPVDASETVSIKVLHKSSILVRGDVCIGSIDIELNELSGRCINGPAHLPLDSPAGRNYGKPTVVIHLLNATSTSVDLSSDVNTAIEAVHRVDHSTGPNDSVTQCLSTLNKGRDLGKSLLALVEKTGVLVNVIDKLSTVHPYVNAAWQLASALYKAVSHQIETDRKLVDLVYLMEDTYDFVTDVKSLPNKIERMKRTIKSLSQQTIECCRFVLHYTNQNFPQRMLKTSRPKVDEFIGHFGDLKRSLEQGIVLQTAFVSARISDKVDDMHFKDMLCPNDMNAFKRGRCLEDTRIEVLNEIMDWLLSGTEQNILWLRGVAGSGKSTVATTIAEYCREMSCLGAFLFFNRVDGAEDQLMSTFRTIAFQLALFDSSIAKQVESAIQRSERIVEAVAEMQFKRLIYEPLMAAREDMQGPTIIVLDALDECGTPESRRTLMSLLKREIGRLPSCFRFLITSRPEADINAVLSSNANKSVHELALDSGSDTSRRDVLQYIDHEIKVIFEDLGLEIPNEWDTYRKRLVDASQGLFIWASTAIKLVKDNPSPLEELESIVGASHLLSGLERLYESVLRNSGVVSERYPSSLTRFSQIFGLILLSNTPLSDTTIDAILGLSSQNSSRLILSKLQSVVAYAPGRPVHLFHTSFADYLLSAPCSIPCRTHYVPSYGQRPVDCLSGPWFIDKSSQQSAIAMRCFIVMKDMLHFNMCGLDSSFMYNKEVDGIDERISEKVPLHLQYACKYWAHHLSEAPFSHELLGELRTFAYERLLYWSEILSLLGQVSRTASRALLDAAAWSGKHDSDISSFLKDASRLTSTFAVPMTESTPHIYVSMLPLMKDDSKVAAHYSRQTSRVLVVDRIGTKRQPLWLKVLEGHSDIVWSVAFSPDGKCVASGSWDGTAKVWDVESGEVLCEFLEENGSGVMSVAFSSNRHRIVSGSWDGTVAIWDVESGEVVSGPFTGRTKGVNTVAFSPEGTHIVSGSEDTIIRVWDVKSGSTIHVLEGHTAAVCSVVFSSDGKRIISGSHDKTIRVWDAMTGQAIGNPFVGHTDEVNSVAISRDDRRIVSGSYDYTVRVWDVESGKVVAGPFLHSNLVNSVAFSSDGRRVLSGCADSTIVVRDVKSGDIVSGPYTGHAHVVRSVAFSPDGSRIVSGSNDKTVRLWDASIGKIAPDSSARHTEAVMCVAFSPDGSWVASGSNDKAVRLWSASTGQIASVLFEGHRHFVNSVAFSSDGKRIVSGSRDERVIIWDVNSGKMTFEPLKGHLDTVTSVAFSPDGTRIVSGSSDRTIIIWNAENGNMIAQSDQVHNTAIGTVAFSPDGTLIASASGDNDVIVWNTESGKCVSGPFKAPEDSTQQYFAPLAFSPDGMCIASRSSDDDIVIRHMQSSQIEFGPLKGHSDIVTSVVFSPNGVYIVSGSYDRSIILWDACNGHIVSNPYKGHTSPITCIAFSPDSSHIVSCSFDATIRIWTVPGKEGYSLTTRTLQGNVVAACSSIQDVDDDFASWTLADNGWVLGPQGELLLWLPPDIRPTLWRPQNIAVFSCEFSTKLNFKDVAHDAVVTENAKGRMLVGSNNTQTKAKTIRSAKGNSQPLFRKYTTQMKSLNDFAFHFVIPPSRHYQTHRYENSSDACFLPSSALASPPTLSSSLGTISFDRQQSGKAEDDGGARTATLAPLLGLLPLLLLDRVDTVGPALLTRCNSTKYRSFKHSEAGDSISETPKDNPPNPTHSGPLNYPTVDVWLRYCQQHIERGRDAVHTYTSLIFVLQKNGCTRLDDVARLTTEELRSLAMECEVEASIGLVKRVVAYAHEDVAKVKNDGYLKMDA
ncbi:WD40 repeat-like protein [Fomitiporia mediterranea MF3/22]|uniref:WD40 repeat-like protein n=1 Tax=Fomitiporia mediterranea (strain MF3/22) TaxID=694068 RepID=UPI0004408667|nr:WD40 repeat-like protein [Fomitiporia mediterranea MF3/22]EJC99863.1 WD40 repeat-like protein [Fomitiporia mediterranea MF3/22]